MRRAQGLVRRPVGGGARAWIRGAAGWLRERGPAGLAVVFAALVLGCATPPPKQQSNLCAVFEQHPDWYDYARQSAEHWGTPIPVLMAFVHHESSYRSHAKPPRRWWLFIPLGRPSSAKGYAQAQDPVWGEYQAERGRLFRSRSDMQDALDFIGWYNAKTSRQLGISRADARNLYLAYHEGRGRLPPGDLEEQAGSAAHGGAGGGDVQALRRAAPALRRALPLRLLVPDLAALPLSAWRRGGPPNTLSRR